MKHWAIIEKNTKKIIYTSTTSDDVMAYADGEWESVELKEEDVPYKINKIVTKINLKNDVYIDVDKNTNIKKEIEKDELSYKIKTKKETINKQKAISSFDKEGFYRVIIESNPVHEFYIKVEK